MKGVYGGIELVSEKAVTTRVISPLKVHCEGYIAFITEDMWSKGVEEVTVVCEFPNVFPDEIPGLPPICEIDFTIELMPGTTPISKAPYRMAPVELRELKTRL